MARSAFHTREDLAVWLNQWDASFPDVVAGFMDEINDLQAVIDAREDEIKELKSTVSDLESKINDMSTRN